MRFQCLENNLIQKRYLRDQAERLLKRLSQIKSRKPIFTKNQNIPILPIIQSSKVARINHKKKIQKQNEKIAQRLVKIVKNGRSQYAYKSVTQRSVNRALSPLSRILKNKNSDSTMF